MDNKLYIITGGAGFIGSARVCRMVKDGYRIRVFDNQSRGSASRLRDVKDKIDFIEGDIRDYGAVSRACQGAHCIIHLAFVNGTEYFYSQPDLVLDVGVKGMIHVMDTCREHGIQELFLASSSEVYQTPSVIPTDETVALSVPDPTNPRYSYAAGKIISEMLALHCGQKYLNRVVIFRPHNVYGPDMGREHVIPQFIERMNPLCQSTKKTILFPIQGSGEETRAFIYIDDLIDGIMLLLKSGKHHQIYHIGTKDEISIAELARLVGRYFEREVKIVSSQPAKGGTKRRCPDISKITQLGFAPKWSLSDGLNKTARWYTRADHAGRN